MVSRALTKLRSITILPIFIRWGVSGVGNAYCIVTPTRKVDRIRLIARYKKIPRALRNSGWTLTWEFR